MMLLLMLLLQKRGEKKFWDIFPIFGPVGQKIR